MGNGRKPKDGSKTYLAKTWMEPKGHLVDFDKWIDPHPRTPYRTHMSGFMPLLSMD
jgi:hypothetical protein